MTSDQMRTGIAGTREEGGEGGKETNMDEKGGGDKTAKEKEEEDHGNKGIVTGSSYLPADPRLVEVHDCGTVVQSTGSNRSASQTLAVNNTPCSQHLRKDTSQGEDGESQGNSNTTDKGDGGKYAEGQRIREIKTIRGGGRRDTRWEKVNEGGEELNKEGDTGSNSNSIKPATYRQHRDKRVGASSNHKRGGPPEYLGTKGGEPKEEETTRNIDGYKKPEFTDKEERMKDKEEEHKDEDLNQDEMERLMGDNGEDI